MDKIESLRILIESQETQNERGNLTETGKAYLNGLKAAYAILGDKE